MIALSDLGWWARYVFEHRSETSGRELFVASDWVSWDYLVDTFQFAASSLAAASVFRSFFGFAFPLFGEQMFAALGYGGGNSLLAGLAIVIGIPFPIWLYFKGEQMRMNSKYARHD